MDLDHLVPLSPFPLVQIQAPDPPRDGFLVSAPAECRKNFARDDRCRQHYQRLEKAPNRAIQCPFGFTSLAIQNFGVAFTGLIPYPRLGGEAERVRAKR